MKKEGIFHKKSITPRTVLHLLVLNKQIYYKNATKLIDRKTNKKDYILLIVRQRNKQIFLGRANFI